MNNLPIEKKDNIFKKIGNFFKNLFKKKEVIAEENNIVEANNIVEDETSKNYNSEIDKLRQDAKKTQNIDYIIKRINEDPTLIGSLSNKRLKQLIKIYDQKIKEINDKTIELDKKLELLENNN